MLDFRRSKLEENYANNADFHKLVTTLRDMIAHHGFTPAEMREALFLAHYKYEMENPMATNLKIKQAMDDFWENKT